MGLRFDEIALGYPVRVQKSNQVGVVVTKSLRHQTVDVLLSGDWTVGEPTYMRMSATDNGDFPLEPFDPAHYPSSQQIRWIEEEDHFQDWIMDLPKTVPSPIQITKTEEKMDGNTHSVTITFTLSHI